MCLSSPKMQQPIAPPPIVPPSVVAAPKQKLRNPRAAGVDTAGVQRRRRGKKALTIPMDNPRINTPT